MRYSEVKEFIRMLPENPLIEYSTDSKVDLESETNDLEVYLFELIANIELANSIPYADCYLKITDTEKEKSYEIRHRLIDFEDDDEAERVTNEVFKIMKEFACKQMMKE